MKKNTKTIVFLAAGAIVIWMIFRRKQKSAGEIAIDLARQAAGGMGAITGGFMPYDTSEGSLLKTGGKTTYGID